MVRSGSPTIVVGSASLLLARLVSPPPETVAVLVTLAGALVATLTVSVSGGALAPAAIGSLRVHESVGTSVHVQPVPANAVAVRPVGSVSVTVIVPIVAAAPAFLTVIV